MSIIKKYLLSTLWTQYGKVISCGNNENLENGIVYNEYAPLNKNFSDNRSYTGCAATATSQIIYYHLLNDFLNEDIDYGLTMDALTEQEAYVSHAEIPAAAVYISADGGGVGETLSFEEINKILSDFVPAPTDPAAGDYAFNSRAAAEYIAALNFSVGVVLKSGYSPIWGTGSVGFASPFLHFGFKSFYNVDFNEMNETERSFWLTKNKQTNNYQFTDEAIEIFIENIENDLPIAFGIPGHAVVLDGYDNTNDLFHLNYGWGPENNTPEDQKTTRWYTRDELRKFSTSGIVIDISPVFQKTFTVTDAGVFGTGTLYRAIQQAAAMQGANIITFDDALAEADVQTLPFALELKDKTTLSGFNITIFAGGNDAGAEEAEPVNEDSGDGENEEQENAGNMVFAFSGEQGSRTEFTDFKGNIIVNSAQKGNYAAFNFSDAVQLSISTGNANIYAGISQLEHSEILDKMNSGNVDELLKNVQKQAAVAGSEGDDQITLDDETIVIGNIELDAGHDSLTIDGSSAVYGDIDMGSGDNKITISAGSSIHGNLLSETELCITLTGEQVSDVLFYITGKAAETFENIISITIDATDTDADEYILFNQGNLKTLLQKLQIKGEGGILQAKNGSIWWKRYDGQTTEAEENDDTPDKIIADGETVSNGTVGKDEQWRFEDGSIATGSLSIHKEGEVKVMTGAEFIFDISSISAGNKNAIINNFDGINGTFLFSVNAALDQAEGSYLLAKNVTEWGFSTPITVTAGEKKLGSFDDEDKAAFTYGDLLYELVYDENKKTLSLFVDSAFRTAAEEDGSIELSWHNPAAATGYWVSISRSGENGSIEIFSQKNTLNIVTANNGKYAWEAIAPGLETAYREGGNFSIDENQAENTASSLFDAGWSDEVVDVFIAESSGIWGSGYVAQHAELPGNWNGGSELCVEMELSGKTRYSDIFIGAGNDSALLYLSDSENGDALFLDDVYSAFPDSQKCERLSYISGIYAGNGDDIIDLTTDKFELSSTEMKIYGGDGNDVIWAGKDSPCYLYGDRGNDCMIGSTSKDCFIGGAGDDVIHGGGGNDLFAYGDPSSWGNDIIYQLPGEGNSVQLFFEQEELENKLIKERFDGGMHISVAGYENSSITIYSTENITAVFAGSCNEYEDIFAAGGCGEFASQNIFEDKSKVMLA